jgi:hypothetical protein
LLEGGEVAARVELVSVADVEEALLRLPPGRALQLLGEDRAAGRNPDHFVRRPEIHPFTCLMLSRDRRGAGAGAGRPGERDVAQSSFAVSTFSGWPLRSVHAQNSSTIQAQRAVGECTSAYPIVCGRVPCSCE